MADVAPWFLWMASPDGQVTFVNRTWTAFTGLGLAHVRGEGWADALHPEDRLHGLAVFRSAVVQRQRFEVEYRLRRADGTYQWILDRGTPVWDVSGCFLGFVGSGMDIHTRKTVTDDLRASEARLRVLTRAVDAAANGIVITNPAGIIEYVNPAFTTLTGYTAEEAIGKRPGQLVKSGHHDRTFYRRMWHTIATGRVWRGELLNRRKDGALYTEEQTITPLCDSAGRVTHYIGIKQDVSERHRAEEALRAANERFALAQRSMPLGVWDWELVADRLTWDDAMYDLFGVDRAAFSPSYQSFLSCLHPDDVAQVEASVGAALGGERNLDLRFRILLPDGSVRHLTGNATVLRDPSGRPVRMVGINLDVTDRIRTQEAHRQSEERFRRTFEESAIGMAVLTPEGRFLRVNRSLCEILGYAEDELLASDFQSITYPDDLAMDLDQVRAVLDGRIRTYQIDKRYFHRNGSIIWAQLNVSLIRDDRGEPLYFVSQIQDITRRKGITAELIEAREIAEQASRAKSEFLANMSHEIRTPLNGILGLAELLQDTELDAEQQEYLALIQHAGTALLTIVNDVLDLSRIEANRCNLQPVPFGLRALLEATVGTFAPRAGQKGIVLSCHVAPDVPDHLLGDDTRFRQIVINLLDNAIKFTPQGEVALTLRLHSRRQDRLALHLQVRDTGIGIPPDRHERIFEAFEQADTSSTRHYGGTGLGLTISARLARMMNGRIWVESAPGQGSTFHVVLHMTAPEWSSQVGE